jgi:squalene-associated FAD-dependent desaturase
MRIAVVGAGWAGMAAAVEAAGLGMDVTVFEATRTLGGRARALTTDRPDGTPLTLDNGQHILIGAYSDTLALMQRVGLDLPQVLMALPLSLPYPDGTGLQTPTWAARWPAPFDALAAIATARGWTWGERLALIRASLGWQMAGFRCEPAATVEQLCENLPDRVVQELIEPLCVSALNLPSSHASAAVFLRVMQDALFGRGASGFSASNLLLPRTDLGSLFPGAAAQWLQQHHGQSSRIHMGARITGLQYQAGRWQLSGEGINEDFDRVVWATPASVAAQTLLANADDNEALASWALSAHALHFTAITTVYAFAPGARLSAPMLALRAEPDAHAAPAQFVFDRGQLNPDDTGVLAFVVSASSGERDELQARVLQQGERQLGLSLQPMITVVEKRATFACTPGLERPGALMAPGLFAAGDYVHGPYPATLEAAVRSGLAAARLANE